MSLTQILSRKPQTVDELIELLKPHRGKYLASMENWSDYPHFQLWEMEGQSIVVLEFENGEYYED